MGVCSSKPDVQGAPERTQPGADNKANGAAPLAPPISKQTSNSGKGAASPPQKAAPSVTTREAPEVPVGNLPVRVIRDGQELGVAATMSEAGTLQFTISTDLEAAHRSFAQLQAVLKGKGAVTELENLSILQSMGLEVRYNDSHPFIGMLVLKLLRLEASEERAGKTYVKVRCEGDRTRPFYAKPEEDSPDSAVFENAQYCFVILHSNAVMLVKARDQDKGHFYGQAAVKVADLRQGTALQDFILHDTTDPARVVATVHAEVTYKWLRGTRDDGAYLGPSRLVMNKRKMRSMMAGIEYISQVNHWMMSHDNVWPARHSDGAGRAASGDHEEADLAGARSMSMGGESPVGALRTRSGSSGASTPLHRWNQSMGQAKQEAAPRSAAHQMNESTLLEALGPRAGDSSEVASLKESLLALMLTFQERMDGAEVVQQQQTSAIQDLFRTVDSKSENAPPASVAIDSAEPFISGTFEYGLGRGASKRKVYIFLSKSQDHDAGLHDASVSFAGVFTTDRSGRLKHVPIPSNIWATPGHYSVIGLLPDDHTYAKGSLFIVKPGTKAVVFDVDGTLTVGDIEVVTMFAIDALAVSTSAAQNLTHKYDLKQRKGALHVVRAWAAKGYQPIYLSGRQGSYFNLTQEWLVRHRYPPGPIHLTKTHLPTLPIYYSVGNFKVAYMEVLKARGLDIVAAYGNTTTDIRAYGAFGIPKERTYIIGPHGGKGGTVHVHNFTDHISDIFALADAEVPIPYTELLITAIPGYKQRTKRTASGADTITEADTSVADSLSKQSIMSVSTEDADDEDDDQEQVVTEAEEIDDDDDDEDATAERQSKAKNVIAPTTSAVGATQEGLQQGGNIVSRALSGVKSAVTG
ncbi:hypothetical protein WJX73_006658 [Symbiochloris irregularis]|uniref:LNS2/PITP domain-containing protein n=1 Tax=Symbiochloris irregularis TaxID=706552 RepID=A0AAW1PBF0_9CHLO